MTSVQEVCAGTIPTFLGLRPFSGENAWLHVRETLNRTPYVLKDVPVFAYRDGLYQAVPEALQTWIDTGQRFLDRVSITQMLMDKYADRFFYVQWFLGDNPQPGKTRIEDTTGDAVFKAVLQLGMLPYHFAKEGMHVSLRAHSSVAGESIVLAEARVYCQQRRRVEVCENHASARLLFGAGRPMETVYLCSTASTLYSAMQQFVTNGLTLKSCESRRAWVEDQLGRGYEDEDVQLVFAALENMIQRVGRDEQTYFAILRHLELMVYRERLQWGTQQWLLASHANALLVLLTAIMSHIEPRTPLNTESSMSIISTDETCSYIATVNVLPEPDIVDRPFANPPDQPHVTHYSVRNCIPELHATTQFFPARAQSSWPGVARKLPDTSFARARYVFGVFRERRDQRWIGDRGDFTRALVDAINPLEDAPAAPLAVYRLAALTDLQLQTVNVLPSSVVNPSAFGQAEVSVAIQRSVGSLFLRWLGTKLSVIRTSTPLDLKTIGTSSHSYIVFDARGNTLLWSVRVTNPDAQAKPNASDKEWQDALLYGTLKQAPATNVIQQLWLHSRTPVSELECVSLECLPGLLARIAPTVIVNILEQVNARTSVDASRTRALEDVPVQVHAAIQDALRALNNTFNVNATWKTMVALDKSAVMINHTLLPMLHPAPTMPIPRGSPRFFDILTNSSGVQMDALARIDADYSEALHKWKRVCHSLDYVLYSLLTSETTPAFRAKARAFWRDVIVIEHVLNQPLGAQLNASRALQSVTQNKPVRMWVESGQLPGPALPDNWQDTHLSVLVDATENFIEQAGQQLAPIGVPQAPDVPDLEDNSQPVPNQPTSRTDPAPARIAPDLRVREPRPVPVAPATKERVAALPSSIAGAVPGPATPRHVAGTLQQNAKPYEGTWLDLAHQVETSATFFFNQTTHLRDKGMDNVTADLVCSGALRYIKTCEQRSVPLPAPTPPSPQTTDQAPQTPTRPRSSTSTSTVSAGAGSKPSVVDGFVPILRSVKGTSNVRRQTCNYSLRCVPIECLTSWSASAMALSLALLCEEDYLAQLADRPVLEMYANLRRAMKLEDGAGERFLRNYRATIIRDRPADINTRDPLVIELAMLLDTLGAQQEDRLSNALTGCGLYDGQLPQRYYRALTLISTSVTVNVWVYVDTRIDCDKTSYAGTAAYPYSGPMTAPLLREGKGDWVLWSEVRKSDHPDVFLYLSPDGFMCPLLIELENSVVTDQPRSASYLPRRIVGRKAVVSLDYSWEELPLQTTLYVTSAPLSEDKHGNAESRAVARERGAPVQFLPGVGTTLAFLTNAFLANTTDVYGVAWRIVQALAASDPSDGALPGMNVWPDPLETSIVVELDATRPDTYTRIQQLEESLSNEQRQSAADAVVALAESGGIKLAAAREQGLADAMRGGVIVVNNMRTFKRVTVKEGQGVFAACNFTGNEWTPMHTYSVAGRSATGVLFAVLTQTQVFWRARPLARLPFFQDQLWLGRDNVTGEFKTPAKFDMILRSCVRQPISVAFYQIVEDAMVGVCRTPSFEESANLEGRPTATPLVTDEPDADTETESDGDDVVVDVPTGGRRGDFPSTIGGFVPVRAVGAVSKLMRAGLLIDAKIECKRALDADPDNKELELLSASLEKMFLDAEAETNTLRLRKIADTLVVASNALRVARDLGVHVEELELSAARAARASLVESQRQIGAYSDHPRVGTLQSELESELVKLDRVARDAQDHRYGASDLSVRLAEEAFRHHRGDTARAVLDAHRAPCQLAWERLRSDLPGFHHAFEKEELRGLTRTGALWDEGFASAVVNRCSKNAQRAISTEDIMAALLRPFSELPEQRTQRLCNTLGSVLYGHVHPNIMTERDAYANLSGPEAELLLFDSMRGKQDFGARARLQPESRILFTQTPLRTAFEASHGPRALVHCLLQTAGETDPEADALLQALCSSNPSLADVLQIAAGNATQMELATASKFEELRGHLVVNAPVPLPTWSEVEHMRAQISEARLPLFLQWRVECVLGSVVTRESYTLHARHTHTQQDLRYSQAVWERVSNTAFVGDAYSLLARTAQKHYHMRLGPFTPPLPADFQKTDPADIDLWRAVCGAALVVALDEPAAVVRVCERPPEVDLEASAPAELQLARRAADWPASVRRVAQAWQAAWNRQAYPMTARVRWDTYVYNTMAHWWHNPSVFAKLVREAQSTPTPSNPLIDNANFLYWGLQNEHWVDYTLRNAVPAQVSPGAAPFEAHARLAGVAMDHCRLDTSAGARYALDISTKDLATEAFLYISGEVLEADKFLHGLGLTRARTHIVLALDNKSASPEEWASADVPTAMRFDQTVFALDLVLNTDDAVYRAQHTPSGAVVLAPLSGDTNMLVDLQMHHTLVQAGQTPAYRTLVYTIDRH